MAPLFEELVRMDLRTLATWIRSENNTANLGQQECRGVVEIFASRLVEEAHDIGPNEWRGLTDALDRAMLSADLDRTESAIRRINLMSALVATVGPSSDSLRNPDAMVAIFLDELPMEFDEATALAANWRQANREDIIRLRSIKNLLTPFVNAERLISDAVGKEAIRKWMTLLDRLP